MLGPELETASWGNFAIASITVVSLLSLLAFGLKILAQRGLLKPASTDKRLQLITTLPLDAKRRLVLTRCDDKEHLLLLGSANDVLISTSPAIDAPSKDSNEQKHDS